VPLGAAFGGVLLQYLSTPRVIAISGLACILALTVTFRASMLSDVLFFCPSGGGYMPRKPPRETPIERMFREASGYKMPASIRRILLRKPRPKLKRH
jgi:hypothetical protein